MCAQSHPAAGSPDRGQAVRTRAHVLPFAVFMGFLMVLQFAQPVIEWRHPSAPWWRRAPEHWLYPLQAVVCFVILLRCWKWYDFRWSWKWSAWGVLFGAVGIGIWLLPTVMYDRLGLQSDPEGWMGWLGVSARTKGFDPAEFGRGAPFWCALVLRFFRAAVVVALVEEIFWRGFLMRFVMDWDGDYWREPFGRAAWKSYLVVTTLFIMAHTAVDRPAAFVYGTLAWLLCVWSKNLGACVVMHATANFLMGCYIMAYGKFGLW